MKKFLLLGAACCALAACGRVEPGHVGIKVNQYGSSAGVDSEVLGVGTYFTPWGVHIYEYPVFTNTYTFTKNEKEGSGDNEEFNFQDKSGLALAADIGVSFSADPSRATVLFQKYRTGMDQIVSGPLRNAIRDALITRAAGLQVDDIYGPGNAVLLANVQNDVQRYFSPYGLRVERLFWAGNVRVPDTVLEQINARIANEQHALAAQAQVATVQAEAQQRIAQAEGEAKAIQVQGDALRTNPQVLQQKAIEKWDGKMPQVTGAGGMPFVNLKE